MYPKGTIYKSSANNIHGEFRVYLTSEEKKTFRRRRFFAAILTSFAITSLIVFYGPSLMLDIEVTQSRLSRAAENLNQKAKTETNVVLASESDNEIIIEPVASSTPTPVVTSVDSFSINIPAINAKSNVIYNVNPFEKTEYLTALQEGVAHASTSGLPGQNKRVYLFAHSTNSPFNFTQYNAVFYQLRQLQEGDEIIATLNGVEHKYIVSTKEIVDSSDTHWLTEQGEGDELILQTCDPPGTTLRRLLVVAKPA